VIKFRNFRSVAGSLLIADFGLLMWHTVLLGSGLFGWNYRPDSDLYVIYTAGQKFASLAAANPAQFYENRFVVKYTYSFRP